MNKCVDVFCSRMGKQYLLKSHNPIPHKLNMTQGFGFSQTGPSDPKVVHRSTGPSHADAQTCGRAARTEAAVLAVTGAASVREEDTAQEPSQAACGREAWPRWRCRALGAQRVRRAERGWPRLTAQTQRLPNRRHVGQNTEAKQ